MKSSHVVVGILCLILGGIAVWLYPKSKGFGGGSPNDSPVTVRGGSIAIANTVGNLNPGHPNTESVESALNSLNIYIDGVVPETTPPWGNVQFPIPNSSNLNWRIVVHNRDKNARKTAQSHNIQMCSSEGPGPSYNQCPPGNQMGNIAASGPYSVYLYLDPAFCLKQPDIYPYEYDSNNNQRQVQLVHDGSDDGGNCAGGSPSKRDHIGTIDVTIGSNTVTYDCVNGQCSVGIGDPPSSGGIILARRKP